MRICDGLLCEETATIWFRGAWCGKCALKRFGKRDVVLAARFSEIHRALEASEPMGLPSPARTVSGASSEAPSAGRASVVASVTASEPGPLLRLLEQAGWVEWA